MMKAGGMHEGHRRKGSPLPALAPARRRAHRGDGACCISHMIRGSSTLSFVQRVTSIISDPRPAYGTVGPPLIPARQGLHHRAASERGGHACITEGFAAARTRRRSAAARYDPQRLAPIFAEGDVGPRRTGVRSPPPPLLKFRHDCGKPPMSGTAGQFRPFRLGPQKLRGLRWRERFAFPFLPK